MCRHDMRHNSMNHTLVPLIAYIWDQKNTMKPHAVYYEIIARRNPAVLCTSPPKLPSESEDDVYNRYQTSPVMNPEGAVYFFLN